MTACANDNYQHMTRKIVERNALLRDLGERARGGYGGAIQGEALERLRADQSFLLGLIVEYSELIKRMMSDNQELYKRLCAGDSEAVLRIFKEQGEYILKACGHE